MFAMNKTLRRTVLSSVLSFGGQYRPSDIRLARQRNSMNVCVINTPSRQSRSGLLFVVFLCGVVDAESFLKSSAITLNNRCNFVMCQETFEPSTLRELTAFTLVSMVCRFICNETINQVNLYLGIKMLLLKALPE